MKKKLSWILIMALLVSCFSFTAFAARASINLGGKVGFMFVGNEVTLRPKLKGVSASQLTWKSSDTSSVIVSGGRIGAKAIGRSVITVSGGGASAKCGVVVLPKTVSITVGEKYSLPNGTVEKYKISNGSIASVSKSGVITAKKAGTATIRVSYGSQKLNIALTVAAKHNAQQSVQQSKAAYLDCADSANQIVLVEYKSGSKGQLSIHEKKNGVWTQLYSCTAYLGSKGIGKTKEGDKKTPTGTFNLTQPFGIKADPGANMDYTQVSKYHYWCGTSGSEYYNRLVDTRKVDRARTASDEYLINYKGYYNYCMFIDYNKNGEVGKGSCIFLHCKGSKNSTAGCIAINETAMKNIIRWAKPGAKIVIK